ncbi:MAG: 1-aminocyclopropane-1-carboxylate deaminase/D-cysteine desulfhydrase [Sandaracinaceae bacterium]
MHPEAEAEGTPVESRALFQAWPSLRGAVPWVPLGRFPTPVTPLDGVAASLGRPGAALYAKRDDLSSPVYGGNKVRTLEALFGRALAAGARRIVATGAYGSNHAAATALHAPRAGLEAGAMLWPQAFSAAAEENLRVVISHVAWLRSLPHWSVFPFALAARRRAGSDHVMVPGGAVPAGGLGYVSAGLELAHQVRAGALPAPATLVLAVGSTCTTAGLLVGLEAAAELGLLPQPPRVLAVRVTPWPITASWRIVSLGVRIAELLASLTGDPRLAFDRRRLGARLTVDGRYLGPGYGAPTDAGRAAIQRFLANGAFRLDTTYSAKAAAALCDRIEAGLDRGPVLYWATKSTAPLPAPSREAWKDGPRRMVRWLDRGPR